MLAISLQLVVAWDDSHQEPLHTWAVRMPAVHGCSKHQTFIHQKLTHTRIANQFALHVFEQNYIRLPYYAGLTRRNNTSGIGVGGQTIGGEGETANLQIVWPYYVGCRSQNRLKRRVFITACGCRRRYQFLALVTSTARSAIFFVTKSLVS